MEGNDTHWISICRRYGLMEKPVGHHIYIQDRSGSQHKTIARLDFPHQPSVVVKMVREDRHPAALIEEQCRFAGLLRRNGVMTPRYLLAEGRHCDRWHIDGIAFDVTVEEYLGPEIETIDHDLACEMGALMARNHSISMENDCHIHGATLFDIASDNDVSGYHAFVRLCETDLRENKLAHRIRREYEMRWGKIAGALGALPRYATQGDYSVNNLVRMPHGLGLFDFNNAGDVSPFSDMLMEGLLVAYEMDLPEDLAACDREGLFEAFVRGYTSVRPLSDIEASLYHEALAVARAMWFSNILHAEDSLARRIEQGDEASMEAMLQRMWRLLTSAT